MSCIDKILRRTRHFIAIGVHKELIQQLRDSPEWMKKLEQAETWVDVEHVLKAFCRERGYSFHHDVVSGRLVPCK